MATVIFVLADPDDAAAGAELVELLGLLGLLDELVLLLTEQPAIASAATAASGRACSRHRLAADVIPDIIVSFGRCLSFVESFLGTPNRPED
jgi:hypothetical protein